MVLHLGPQERMSRPPLPEASMCFWNIRGLGIADPIKGGLKRRATASSRELRKRVGERAATEDGKGRPVQAIFA